MKKFLRFLAGAAVLMFAASAGIAADTIKVGFVDTYSGPATTFTNDVLDGFKMAAEKINAKGGVLGRKITYV
ncbi:MAG TPA: ABC transporter substrate-binding protein, partial [Candidatus Deferrimicrobium sp.]